MSKHHLNRIIALVLTLAMVLSVGFVLPVAADEPIELGYLHASSGTTQTSGGEITLNCDNPYGAAFEWKNMYAESADCVQIYKSGNDQVYNIGALTEHGTSDGILVSHNGTELILRNSQWNLNCANQSGTSPLAYGDTIIVGGNFTCNGSVFHVSTTYITKDADGYIHCSDTFEAGTFTPAATTDGFLLTAEYKCYSQTWAQFYAESAANVKLFRNGSVYNIGALTEHGTSDGIIVSRNGNVLFLRNSQWNLNCTGISGLSPMTAGDVIYVGGNFTSSAGQTIHVKPTYMYMDAQGNLTTADAYNVGTLSADSTHPTKSGDDIYGIAEDGYNAGNWTEYKADSMDCVKLRKSGSDTYVSIGIPGSQNIMRKRGDNVFCVTNSQYYLNLAGHSELSPLAEGDVMIVEGNFTGVSDGITAHIERTYITIVNGNLVFSTTEPVAATHTATAVPAAAPDCTNAGNSAYYYCYECDDAGEGEHYGKYYSDAALTTEIDPVIPANGHTWVTGATVLPTCTTAGYTTQTCSVCNATQQINPVAATGHTLVYSDNGDGTHDATCSVCSTLIVDDEACTYENGVCTLCGAAEPVADPYLDPALVFDTSALALEAAINSQFIVNTRNLSAFSAFKVGYVHHSTATGEDETGEIETTVLTARYSYVNIPTPAYALSDSYEVTLYGYKDGVWYHGESVDWSVRDAAISMMTTTSSETLKTLLASMLNYGAYSQLQFNVNTDDLANATMTPEQAAYALTSPTSALTDDATQTPSGTGCTYNTCALLLESIIEMQFIVRASTTSAYPEGTLEAHISYTYGGQTYNEVVDAHTLSGRIRYVSFSGLASPQMRTVVTCEFFDKTTGNSVSPIMTYSAQTYANSVANNANATQASKNLANAVMCYIDAAIAHFG